MERNTRKVYVGKVVSDKEDKTIKVLVVAYRKKRFASPGLPFYFVCESLFVDSDDSCAFI